MDPILERLSVSVESAKSLGELTRPLLEMLASETGLESAYLTTVDLQEGRQHIQYARNVGVLDIPEGLSVPWVDTLCKRALESDEALSEDVSACWDEVAGARALGIRTYVGTPVRYGNGELYGTLCAASVDRRPVTPQSQRILRLFAALVAQHVERERLVQRLVEANERLAGYASTDHLTALANRRLLEQELARLLALGARRQVAVLIAFVDLDGFKAVNDAFGHAAGDQFLVQVAQRLRAVLRAEDLAARIGGDEFMVIGPGPAQPEAWPQAQRAFQERVFQATVGEYQLAGERYDYPGASVGALAVAPGTLDARQAIEQADAAMYAVKAARRPAPGGTAG